MVVVGAVVVVDVYLLQLLAALKLNKCELLIVPVLELANQVFPPLTILDLALAVGLEHVDESSDGQGDKKANDADHNIESDCHEPCALK